MAEGYTPTVAALEAAWVAQRTGKGTAADVARAEFARAVAAIRGETHE